MPQLNPWILNFIVFIGKVFLGFLIVIGISKIVGPLPFSITSVVTQKSDVYSVTGEGRVDVKPDVAVINLGVQANAPTVKEVQDRVNTKINQVKEAIKKLGIEDKDIKTENYNIYPNYDTAVRTLPLETSQTAIAPVPADQRISGYSANTNLRIKIKDLDKVNQIIDSATANGANQIGGVSFDVDDRIKAESEAREKAVKAAKEKAQQAAKVAGFKLGRLINYSEGGDGKVMPLLSQADVSGRGGGTTQIEPGTSEIVVNVTLSYEIQ